LTSLTPFKFMNQNIEIIFENENFIVVNKPSGLIVNRATSVKVSTLQDYIEENIEMDLDDVESDFVKRNGIVHRLDKDTSGVMIVAKNETYFTYLQSLFKERLVKKEYVAVCLGEVTEERFEIDAPIGRDPKSRFKFAIVRGEKESQTFFERIKVSKEDERSFTSINCFPKTGRTHQIRVHMSQILHTPILCDPIYGGSDSHLKKVPASIYQKLLDYPYQLLHAKELGFVHPITKEKLHFIGQRPEIFEMALQALSV